MKAKLISCLVSVAVLVIGASTAQATMIAGWDFSQYFADGALSTDGSTLTNTLGANYTDRTGPGLDVPGPDAAVFGTMYLNGQFGSTNTPLDGTDPFVPSSAAGGSLTSNLDAPAGPDFDSFGILTTNGQQFANPLAMSALAAATVVFGADLGSANGSGWSISFGGKTASGTSVVSIAFSTDGTTFTSFAPVTLTAVDTLFTVNFGGGPSGVAYARLTFDPTSGQEPFIDNFALNAAEVVPEPAAAVMLLVGLAGLRLAGRRRT